jgi:pSer/pThr/pTyr-binding forkhead associated (FHA) protein
MDVRLVIEKGRTPVRAIHLHQAETVIGRRRGTTLRIPSAEVSREHCRILMEDGYLTVEDLDSVNGTYLNGVPITSREVLRPGDRLQVGPIRFVVEYQLTQEVLDRLLHAPTDEVVEAVVDTDEEAPEAIIEDETAPVEVADPGDDLALPEDEDAEDIADAVAALDDHAGWEPPQADDMRDILSNLDGTDEQDAAGQE